ncbi:Putative RxLR effector [Phytophthora palmivora]|uniref:RxLR effector protein n=1 Tax=Phytophthora palmivora TaxID=4796 RepID=A0A2P4YVK6_9STRA|nr:Putative RxLR effector [Phytophthora palmivora]
MRLNFTVLVVAAIFLWSCDADSNKLRIIENADLDQSADDVLTNDNRILRKSDTNTNEEERVIDWTKLFKSMKVIGRTKKTVKNEAIDFTIPTIEKMAKDRRFREKMFKQWKLYERDEVVMKLENLAVIEPRAKTMLENYKIVHG